MLDGKGKRTPLLSINIPYSRQRKSEQKSYTVIGSFCNCLYVLRLLLAQVKDKQLSQMTPWIEQSIKHVGAYEQYDKTHTHTHEGLRLQTSQAPANQFIHLLLPPTFFFF